MLYQTLAGCWPPDLDPGDEAGVHALAQRVARWQLKALREAKLRTNWLAPDESYESDCQAFLADILAPQRRDGFLDALSEADWDRLVSAVVGVNTSVVDPKGIRQIGSAGDQTSDESSKPPERLA